MKLPQLSSMGRYSIWFPVVGMVSLTLLALVLMVMQFHSVATANKSSADQMRGFRSGLIAAQASIEDARYLQAHYPAFLQLMKKFPASDVQRRVQWIKVLEAAKREVGIEEMGFDVYPYQSSLSDQESLKVTAGFEQIVMRLSLLHDGKLASLLTYLERHAPNSFVVSSLEVEKTNNDAADSLINLQAVRLKAELTIRWYLIDVKGEVDALAS